MLNGPGPFAVTIPTAAGRKDDPLTSAAAVEKLVTIIGPVPFAVTAPTANVLVENAN